MVNNTILKNTISEFANNAVQKQCVGYYDDSKISPNRSNPLAATPTWKSRIISITTKDGENSIIFKNGYKIIIEGKKYTLVNRQFDPKVLTDYNSRFEILNNIFCGSVFSGGKRRRTRRTRRTRRPRRTRRTRRPRRTRTRRTRRTRRRISKK
jgi:hypothetical protein